MPTLVDKMQLSFDLKDGGVLQGLKKIEKGADNAAGSLSKLGGINKLTGIGFKGLAVAAGGAAAAIKATFDAARRIDSLSSLALGTKTTATELDLFGRVSRDLGGNLEAAQANIASFSDKMRQAAALPYSETAQYFHYLGIRTRDASGGIRSASDALQDLSKRLQNMSQPRALEFLNRLGITEKGLAYSILEGPTGLKRRIEYQKQFGTITERQIEIARDLRRAQDEVGYAYEGVKNKFLEAFGPAAAATLRGFSAVLTDSVKNPLQALALPAVGGAVGFAIAGPLGGAIGSVGTYLGTLIIDDIVNYVKGNGSLIGDAIAKWPVLAPIGTGLKAIGDGLRYLYNLLPSTTAASNFLSGAWTKTKDFFGSIPVSTIPAGTGSGPFSYLNKDVSSGYVKNPGGWQVPDLWGSIKSFFNQDVSSGSVKPPFISKTPGPSSNNVSMTNNIDVTINDAQGLTADDVSAAIVNQLNLEMLNAGAEFDNGLRN